MIYATKKELEEALKKAGLYKIGTGNYCTTGMYTLGYNEYERPEYKPTRYKDGWGIKKLNFFYGGTSKDDYRLDKDELEYLLS